MVDNFGREIDYARISLTDRCNLRCKYCMPTDGIDKKECTELLRYEEIENIIIALSELDFKKIRFTGGEPLIRKNVVNFLVNIIKKYKNISFYITTNAINLSECIKPLSDAGLKGVNISIDTLNAENYKKITRGGDLNKALDGLYSSLSFKNLKVKLNSVLSKELSLKEIKDLINLTKIYDMDVRFIELMPIGECKNYAIENYQTPDFIFDNIKELIPIEVESHSVANYFKLNDGLGKVGFISPITCKFCNDCNRLRITADGMLKPCLHSDEEVFIKDVSNNKFTLKNKILDTILNKPKEHDLKNNTITRDMKRIGG